MGWFGWQGKQSKKQLAAWTAEAAWVQDLSASAAQQVFGELFDAFEGVKKLAKLRSYVRENELAHRNQLIPQLEAVRDEWLSVDRSRLSEADAHTLFEVLRVTLPEIAGVYRVWAGESSIYAALTGYRFNSYNILYSSDERVLQRLTDCYKLLAKIRHDQWAAGYSVFAPKVSLSFPAALQSDRTLKASVTRLHQLWVAAGKRKLSVEDQHFVDEVAARYVPDAVKALQSFVGEDLGLQREARAIFLDQLRLMAERLERVVSSKQHSLDEMRAQARFLREVTA